MCAYMHLFLCMCVKVCLSEYVCMVISLYALMVTCMCLCICVGMCAYLGMYECVCACAYNILTAPIVFKELSSHKPYTSNAVLFLPRHFTLQLSSSTTGTQLGDSVIPCVSTLLHYACAQCDLYELSSPLLIIQRNHRSSTQIFTHVTLYALS